jgi:hypothetical protein
MEEKDYQLIFVGNTQVGLIGLREIFEELKGHRKILETDLKQMLVEKAAKKNISLIPSRKITEKPFLENLKNSWVRR